MPDLPLLHWPQKPIDEIRCNNARGVGVREKMNERRVFILEIADVPAFAFEAKSYPEAEKIIKSCWFSRSLDGFFGRIEPCENRGPLRVRIATEAEAMAHCFMADEFADALGCLVVTHLSDKLLAATNDRHDERRCEHRPELR